MKALSPPPLSLSLSACVCVRVCVRLWETLVWRSCLYIQTILKLFTFKYSYSCGFEPNFMATVCKENNVGWNGFQICLGK